MKDSNKTQGRRRLNAISATWEQLIIFQEDSDRVPPTESHSWRYSEHRGDDRRKVSARWLSLHAFSAATFRQFLTIILNSILVSLEAQRPVQRFHLAIRLCLGKFTLYTTNSRDCGAKVFQILRDLCCRPAIILWISETNQSYKVPMSSGAETCPIETVRPA